MSNSSGKMTKALFILVSAMVLATIVNNFYIFYFQKNYDFIVEASCDPTEQACFVRSCGEDSECPPNELEQYRMFVLKASDFEKCSDDSCLNECVMGAIQCEEVLCGDSEEDICTASSQ